MLVMVSVVLSCLGWRLGAHNETRGQTNKQLCPTTVIGTFQDIGSVMTPIPKPHQALCIETAVAIGRLRVYAPRMQVLESSQPSEFWLETTPAGIQ
jgi:hypothetical protein